MDIMPNSPESAMIAGSIAFDFDGVIIPDCLHIPNLGGRDQYYALTQFMLPLIRPQGRYRIITGRQAQYRAATWNWCVQHLTELPQALYHERDPSKELAEEYKARVLNANPEIRTYVESDSYIVLYLERTVTTGCRIIHFDTFVNQAFESVSKR